MKFKKPITTGKLPTFLGEPKKLAKTKATSCKTKTSKTKTKAAKKKTTKRKTTILADRKF